MQVRTRYGLMDVPDTANDLIGRFLSRYGEWAWDEVSFLSQFLPATGARVLDIGGYVGTFGLGLARGLDLALLVAVEGNSAVAGLLRANLARNCPSEFEVVQAVAGARGKLYRMELAETDNLGSAAFKPTWLGPSENVGLEPCVTLSELRERWGPFDLVKLDVEGMEHEILGSDAEVMSSGRCTIWAECNEVPGSLELASLLISWGLEVHYFAFPCHNPDNFLGEPDPVFPFAYEAGLLAAPRCPPHLSPALAAHHCILKQIRSEGDLKDALWRTPRWGVREWIGSKPEELAALAGHTLLGQNYQDYLSAEWSAPTASNLLTLNESLSMQSRRMAMETTRANRAEAALAEMSVRTLDLLARNSRAEHEAAGAALDAKAVLGAVSRSVRRISGFSPFLRNTKR